MVFNYSKFSFVLIINSFQTNKDLLMTTNLCSNQKVDIIIG